MQTEQLPPPQLRRSVFLPRLRQLCISAFCVFLGLASASILAPDTMLSPLGRYLVYEKPIASSDAIVVLLGQNNNHRTRLASDLFKRGLATRIIVVAGFYGRPWYAVGEPAYRPWIPAGWDYRTRLMRDGVPADAIEIVNSDRAADTASELLVVVDHLRLRNLHSVALVSSSSHTRRLSSIWERVAPGIPYGVYGASHQDLEHWWRTQAGRWTIAYEYGALVKEAWRRLSL